MSSVMMSRTFGAPLGGTTLGAHQGVESLALSLITPPNVGGNGGSCFPSSEVVALGDPGVPVTFWSSIVFSFCSDSYVISYRRGLASQTFTRMFTVARTDYPLRPLARTSLFHLPTST